LIKKIWPYNCYKVYSASKYIFIHRDLYIH
jgi:hypothetical protein